VTDVNSTLLYLDLLKSHIHAYTRVDSKTGNAVQVSEHEDSRVKHDVAWTRELHDKKLQLWFRTPAIGEAAPAQRELHLRLEPPSSTENMQVSNFRLQQDAKVIGPLTDGTWKASGVNRKLYEKVIASVPEDKRKNLDPFENPGDFDGVTYSRLAKDYAKQVGADVLWESNDKISVLNQSAIRSFLKKTPVDRSTMMAHKKDPNGGGALYHYLTLKGDDAKKLKKSHVKAHVRKNPKTGALERVKDYDDSRLKHTTPGVLPGTSHGVEETILERFNSVNSDNISERKTGESYYTEYPNEKPGKPVSLLKLQSDIRAFYDYEGSRSPKEFIDAVTDLGIIRQTLAKHGVKVAGNYAEPIDRNVATESELKRRIDDEKKQEARRRNDEDAKESIVQAQAIRAKGMPNGDAERLEWFRKIFTLYHKAGRLSVVGKPNATPDDAVNHVRALRPGQPVSYVHVSEFSIFAGSVRMDGYFDHFTEDGSAIFKLSAHGGKKGSYDIWPTAVKIENGPLAKIKTVSVKKFEERPFDWANYFKPYTSRLHDGTHWEDDYFRSLFKKVWKTVPDWYIKAFKSSLAKLKTVPEEFVFDAKNPETGKVLKTKLKFLPDRPGRSPRFDWPEVSKEK
jgi:hypothetical protein